MAGGVRGGIGGSGAGEGDMPQAKAAVIRLNPTTVKTSVMLDTRHSGAGRNPVLYVVRSTHYSSSCAAHVMFELDSGLRRNDEALRYNHRG